MRSPLASAVVAVLLTSGCGASGDNPPAAGQPGSGPRDTSVRAGLGLPRVVEAVPAKDVSAGALRSAVTAADGLPADCDYARTQTVKVLSEPTVRVFDFLNALLDALSFAHHDDPAVVNRGPYSVMVPYVDESDEERSLKKLSRWVVDSWITTVDGAEVNRVQLWASQPVMWYSQWAPRVQFDIREPPRRNADGSYADYGVWTAVAKIREAPLQLGHGWFAASASRDASGAAVLRFRDNEFARWEEKGILVTTGNSGAGWVVIPEGGECSCAGVGCTCTPSPITNPETVYAYDADTLTIRKEALPPVSKNRNDVVDFATRIGVFDAETGAEAESDLPFDLDLVRPGVTERHLRWAIASANGVSGPMTPVPGETLVLKSPPAGAVSPVYTVSETFTGDLVRTDLIPAAVEDVRGIIAAFQDCTQVAQGVPCRFRYVYFTGDGWLEKTVLSTDEYENNPVFDPLGDFPYEMTVGHMMHVGSDEGAQYRVTRTGTSSWDVRRVLTIWGNLASAATMVPPGVTLQYQGCGAGCPTFRFDSDPASPTFLKMVYASIPPTGMYPPAQVGDVAPGFMLTVSGAGGVEHQFQWTDGLYTKNYLLEGGEFVRFMDLLRFEPVTLRTRDGAERRYFMQSWGTYTEPPNWNSVMNGLYDSGFQMTPEIAAKVVSVPNGTELVEYGGTRRFLAKQLRIDQYLLETAPAHLDLSAAEALRGSELTSYVEPEPVMGTIPTEEAAPLRFIEGRPAS